MSLQRFSASVGRQQIEFVQHQPALFLGQIGAELLQFGRDRARILHRIGFRVRRDNIH